MRTPELTPESILAAADTPQDVLAGHAAAIAETEAALAAYKAALAEVERALRLHEAALDRANEAWLRTSQAAAKMRTYGQAVDRLGAAAKFLNIIESN